MTYEYRWVTSPGGRGDLAREVACCEALYRASGDLYGGHESWQVQREESSGCESCGPYGEPVGEPFRFCPWCGSEPPYVRREVGYRRADGDAEGIKWRPAYY